MTFNEWLSALDTEASTRGYAGDKPMTSCGEDCWRASYDEGMTPLEAIEHDESYA